MVEIWKDIEGYEGLYQVSNFGRVKSLTGWDGRRYIKREKILKQYKQYLKYDYCRYKVDLKKNNVKKCFKVHRLIAKAFIPNPNNYPIINHKDGNPLNNNVTNLEWCTQKYNVEHAIKNGLKKINKPTKSELIGLYLVKRKSLKEISRLKKINIATLKKYLKEYDIKIRSLSESGTKYFIDKEFLKNELKSKNQIQIAKELKCDASLISKYKKKFNI